MASAENFTTEGVDLLHVPGAAKKNISVGLQVEYLGLFPLHPRGSHQNSLSLSRFRRGVKPYTPSLSVTRRSSWGNWSSGDQVLSYQFFDLVGYCRIGIICIFFVYVMEFSFNLE